MRGAPVLRNQRCPVSEGVPLVGNLRNLQYGPARVHIFNREILGGEFWELKG